MARTKTRAGLRGELRKRTRPWLPFLSAGLWAAAFLPASAGTWYVSPDGSDFNDGKSWPTAKATIQAAVDTASAADFILVTNGVYGIGGRALHPGWLTNRVAIDKPVIVQSVNGPAETVIEGSKDPAAATGLSNAAVRCVYLTNGATLSGFTLRNGHTSAGPGYDSRTNNAGGGAYCESSARVSNCWLIGNAAYYGGGSYQGRLEQCLFSSNQAMTGGGAYTGTLYNCRLEDNRATIGGAVAYAALYSSILRRNLASNPFNNAPASTTYGGGAYYGALINCTLLENRAVLGGGAYGSVLTNCIAYYNYASQGADNWHAGHWPQGSLTYCTTTPLPPGAGNTTNAPLLLALNNPRLLAGSPGIDAGTNQAWMTGTRDIEGNLRIANGIVDRGAVEFNAATSAFTGPLTVAISTLYTQAVVHFLFVFDAQITGAGMGLAWDFGDLETAAQACRVAHAYSQTGTYEVVLTASNLEGMAAATVTVEVTQGDYYVADDGLDEHDGRSWAEPKATIQAAVNEALPGATIWVSNGLYNVGGRAATPVLNGLTNRVAVDKPVHLRSMNGPDVTRIVGAKDPQTTNGPRAVRCVYLADGASLTGFTLANGHTSGGWEDHDWNLMGGGIWCESIRATVSNCVMAGNRAEEGGGIMGGTLHDCRLENNVAHYLGGGAQNSLLWNCQLRGNRVEGDEQGDQGDGGGAYLCQLTDCAVSSNFAGFNGGGVSECVLDTCTLAENNTYGDGGGACRSTLARCTLVDNRADNQGGGAHDSTLTLCELANNDSGLGGGASDSTLFQCLLRDNHAGYGGGGAAYCDLQNSSLAGNSADVYGGGAYESSLLNSIVYYNTAVSNANWYFWSEARPVTYTCTTPLPPGTGNSTAEPQFADYPARNLRLLPNSPCVNAGLDQAWMDPASVDLDGLPRIQNGRVDLGPYESAYWGMFSDIDEDGFSDFVEVTLAGTDPTNSQSFLGMAAGSTDAQGVIVRWNSVSGKCYRLLRATNLVAGFDFVVRTNVSADPPMNCETDSTAIGSGPWFYRVELDAAPGSPSPPPHR